ncbi:ubiquitin-specific protease UBP2 SCDLUD_003225 [Saccharomycodes ludwigii]|uniref:ubiquitin-specific protease UBP2 n=1 Tax=Saccharomycodes ludwigii TaxID=36035 RepID=UPI001E8A011F|nr:hypothetical protein SCDLUD_003225 [Saccharomycodes ludwigii]KAH3900253.1 hypothetical protein SCDLUD_003225 [Saccharomycodes ludwigii]
MSIQHSSQLNTFSSSDSISSPSLSTSNIADDNLEKLNANISTNKEFSQAQGPTDNIKNIEKNSNDENLKDTTSITEIKLDDGKTNLYPNLCKTNFPFKTSDRLLDDIYCSLYFINNQDTGILQKPPIAYSRERTDLQLKEYEPNLLHLMDQVTLKTKYEYPSKSCPNDALITVFMAVLYEDEDLLDLNTPDDIVDLEIYHVKITIKSKKQMELRYNVGVDTFHLVSYDELHPFDKQDIHMENKEKTADSAIYISPLTNKIIMIEILRPEFNEDVLSTFQLDKIENRIKNYYHHGEGEKYTKTEDTTDPDGASKSFDLLPVPTQVQCLSTFFKIIKGPLVETTVTNVSNVTNDGTIINERKCIPCNNKSVITKIDPELLTKYLNFTIERENEDEYFLPPLLINYMDDLDTRFLRDSFTRKCLEIIVIGNLSQKQFYSASSNTHYFKIFQLSSSQVVWYHLLHQHISNTYSFIEQLKSQLQYNTDYHFIDLSCYYYYDIKSIIKNYQTCCNLDPDNMEIYYDALTYVANCKHNQQLFVYCSSLDLVGKEALDGALITFGIDPQEIVKPQEITDDAILRIYENIKQSIFYKGDNEHQVSLMDLKNALHILAKFKKSSFLKFIVNHEPYNNIIDAYYALDLEPNMKDVDIIQTAYLIKVSDAPGLQLDCDRAIYSLAFYLRSLPLFNFLIAQCPDFNLFYNTDEISYDDALERIGVNSEDPDNAILDHFYRKWNGDENLVLPANFIKLRRDLLKIAIQRKSKLLEHFIETGNIDESLLPAGNWPAGLNNIGNTCYLNSLLQYYFSISPLRNYTVNYQKTTEDLLSNVTISKRRIGGREVSRQEMERSVQFTYQLRNLFDDMIHTPYKCCTPKKELAYLAFAPSNVSVEFEDEEDCTTLVAKISPDQLENALEMGRQQDVTECIGNVLFQLETASEPLKLEQDDEQYDLIKQLFYGKSKQTLVPVSTELGSEENTNNMDNKPVSEKFERFLSLLVDVSDKPRDIYDALDSYFQDDELLTMDEYGQVKRVVVITELPDILQIQIQRVYYDRERFMPYKNITAVPFKDKIYMDRYMEHKQDGEGDKDTFNNLKLQYGQLKQKLKRLQETKLKLCDTNEVGLTVKDALLETSKFLKSDLLVEELEMNEDNLEHTITTLNEMAKTMDLQSKNIVNEIEALEMTLDTFFDDSNINGMDNFRKHGYSLFAVFIHRGEASYGHYWVYIKEKKSSDTRAIWRKYNDENVTEVDESEVFNFTQGNTATPYFLVYVKEDLELEIEPLKRIINLQE